MTGAALLGRGAGFRRLGALLGRGAGFPRAGALLGRGAGFPRAGALVGRGAGFPRAGALVGRGAGFPRVGALLGVVAALAMAAWFGLGVHQAVSVDRASALIGTPGVSKLTAPQAARVSSWLASAGFLNPDRSVVLDRSAVALARGQVGLARRLARSVTTAEPENIEAWVALARASGGDPALFRYALGRAAALEPVRPS